MKKLFVGVAVLAWGVCAMAQTPDVAVMPNTDDFLGPTYALPDQPVFVETPESSPSNHDILTEIFGSNAITLNANQPVKPIQNQSQTFKPIPGMYYPKQSILTKLPDLPEPALTYERVVDTTITPVIKQPDYADKLLQAAQDGKRPTFTIPREIRLSFYPGQFALSAQSLKWIKAFALKVRDDPRLVIEIRASEEDWPLQSKRVALMLQAVTEQGVSRHQIYVYKSPRDPDTVLLGYGRAVDKEIKKEKKRRKTITW